MSILQDTFCIYCQHDYVRPAHLQNHIESEHKGTYAYHALLAARGNPHEEQTPIPFKEKVRRPRSKSRQT